VGGRAGPLPLRFAETDRYRVVRTLGSGGCGIVYEAFDGVRNESVALKTLARLDGAALLRFKQEFRALADVSHPNVVQLYDLSAGSSDWFFTMELVKGNDFLAHVRGRLSLGHDDEHARDESGETLIHDPRTVPDAQISAPAIRFKPNYDLLRDALRQLAVGVNALHGAGMLHRDLKPSNVMVTREGRVVILDFGIVTELAAEASRITDVDAVVGTPAYMAPEQASGLPLSEASDWYAVGVILYEALTGTLPFRGATLKVLSDKQSVVPPSPREIDPSVPADLNELCVALLAATPEERPSAEAVLRTLGAEASSGRAVISPSNRTSQGGGMPMLGREQALSDLHAAYASSRAGSPVVAFVHGASGMGKSVLIRRFVDEVSADAVVLAGRCYERESIPYKAFDAVVDALSRWMGKLPGSAAASLLPRDASALARLFPVLARVPAIANATRRAIPDPQQLRARAFAALRELLGRIADKRPLVVAIDDLQWGDLDSASLFVELFASADAPSALIVLGHRSDDVGIADTVRRALDERNVEIRDIALERLSPERARALAIMLLGDDTLSEHPIVDAVARESGGSPYNVGELVRYIQTDLTRRSAGGIRIDRALTHRIEGLDPEVHRLLCVIAHAGKPISPEIAFAAADIADADAVQALSILRVGYLVRSAVTRTQRTVECFHDRVRETVVRATDAAEARAIHTRLADAMIAAGEVDPETLLLHFQAASLFDRASEYAIASAEKAARALAFDRAADFYRSALELSTGEPARALRVELANALSHAGRGADAAAAYLAALDGATDAEQVELRRQAAEQLLVSGHIDAGIREIHAVLNRVGVRLPSTPLTALLTLLLLRVLLSLRGYRFVARDSSSVSAKDLSRIDLYRSLAFGLGAVDNIRGAAFQTRHLLLCLRNGEPTRLARAFNVEVTFLALQGARKQAQLDRLLDAVRELARTVPRADVEAPVELAAAGAYYFTGRFRAARRHAERAVEIIRDRTSGMHWELDNIEFFNTCAMSYLGDIDQLRRRVPALLREAEDRGDLFLLTNLRVGDCALVWLADNQAEESRRRIAETMARWSHRSFHIQHSYEASSLCQIDLYEGSSLAAYRRACETWPKLRRALQTRIQLSRIKLFFARGRAAVTAARDAPEGLELMLAGAAADARRLEREARWSRGLGTLIRAGIADQRGALDECVRLLARAESELIEADLALHAAATRVVLGAAMGGDRGKEIKALGMEWMDSSKVVDPASLSRMLVPVWRR
jgi:eukaryotic-like serine/threonine-protein kinase